MILSLLMPRAGAEMQQGSVHRLVAQPGDVIKPGTPLLEVRVDLGAAKAQDCPPLFFFRVVATERAVVRAINVAQGQMLEVGAAIGLATSTAEESVDGQPQRAMRTTVVAIQVDPLSR